MEVTKENEKTALCVVYRQQPKSALIRTQARLTRIESQKIEFQRHIKE